MSRPFMRMSREMTAITSPPGSTSVGVRARTSAPTTLGPPWPSAYTGRRRICGFRRGTHPAFRAVVSGRRAAAALPNIEPVLTIEPPPFSRIAGAVCFIPSHTPVRSDTDNSVPQVPVRCKTRRRRIIEAQIPHNLSPRPRHIFLCKRARRQRRA